MPLSSNFSKSATIDESYIRDSENAEVPEWEIKSKCRELFVECKHVVVETSILPGYQGENVANEIGAAQIAPGIKNVHVLVGATLKVNPDSR